MTANLISLHLNTVIHLEDDTTVMYRDSSGLCRRTQIFT